MSEIIDRIAKGEEKLFCREEICEKLSISPITLDRWRRTPRKDNPDLMKFPNPDFNIGGSPRWTMTTFKDWLAKQLTDF